jgi:hypothetical protein
MTLIYLPPCEMDVDYLAKHMSEADKAEVLASGQHSPREAISFSLDRSWFSRVAVFDNKPIAVFGCATADYEGNIGSPWLLSTGEFFRLPVSFFRDSKEYIQYFLEMYSSLIVNVHAKNAKSIHWLKTNNFKSLREIEVNDEKFLTMELKYDN